MKEKIKIDNQKNRPLDNRQSGSLFRGFANRL